MLDGALGTEARARRARLGGGARLWVGNLPMGSHFIEGGARRGTPVARPWGVGRGAQIPLREHPRSAPRVLTVPNELTNECLWGGSAPPNGSRLSCGRLARRRKSSGRQSVPRQGHNTPLPLRRSSPGSFKRMLGGGPSKPRVRHCHRGREESTRAPPHRQTSDGYRRPETKPVPPHEPDGKANLHESKGIEPSKGPRLVW